MKIPRRLRKLVHEKLEEWEETYGSGEHSDFNKTMKEIVEIVERWEEGESVADVERKPLEEIE